MNEFVVSLYPELLKFGALRKLKGTLHGEISYKRGQQTLSVPDGIDYDMQLSNIGEAILLTGTVHCSANAFCDRCLKPLTLDIDAAVDGYYLIEPTDELDDYERDDIDCVDTHGNFNIAGPINAALVFETPFVILCDEKCAGLCPHCGADLNEGPCGCKPDDRIDGANPFAALKDYKFDT